MTKMEKYELANEGLKEFLNSGSKQIYFQNSRIIAYFGSDPHVWQAISEECIVKIVELIIQDLKIQLEENRLEAIKESRNFLEENS